MQHAIQKIAVAQASGRDKPVTQIIRELDELCTNAIRRVYGDDKNVPKHDATVTLNLPIRVGLAFLPPRSGNPKDGPTAAQRERILGTIRTNFDDLPYVSEIVPLPSYYFDYTRNDGMQQRQAVIAPGNPHSQPIPGPKHREKPHRSAHKCAD